MSWWRETNARLAAERGIAVLTQRVGDARYRARAFRVEPDPHHPGDYLLGDVVARYEAPTYYRAWAALAAPVTHYPCNPNN